MNFKTTKGNVLVKVELNKKNTHQLTPNTKIILTRAVENFDRKYTEPMQGVVVDAEKIPTGNTVLIHHNACQPSYEIMELEPGIKLFSVPVDLVFCYSKDLVNWTACDNFLISLRIFKPYKGALYGVTSSVIPHRLYIVSGKLEDGEDISGRVCVVTKNSDYQIIYQGNNGREAYVLRTRQREILSFDDKTLSLVQEGEYLLGYSYQDADTIHNIYAKKIKDEIEKAYTPKPLSIEDVNSTTFKGLINQVK